MNAPAGNTVSTAELAFALLLSAARYIPAADRSLREGHWDRKSFRGGQLSGKTLGVVGAGRIGTAVIQRARAFGMKVMVADPYMTEERARDMYVELMKLDDMLPVVDFLTLHVPLTGETKGLLDAERIGRMQPHAVVVNAARGGIVEEEALACALGEGRLAAAALDVYQEEPLPADHPLRAAPNLVLTPHLGAATHDAQREVAILRAIERGKDPRRIPGLYQREQRAEVRGRVRGLGGEGAARESHVPVVVLEEGNDHRGVAVGVGVDSA